ncbi:MAG: ACP S-malonyltransferase [Pseudomonadales bacterium]
MSNVAFVFPGQGSQEVGMLADLMSDSSIVVDCFAEASSVLGYDLRDLVLNGPEDTLNQTEYTQPALLTASIAIWRVAVDREVKTPDLVAGHSLGEYSALVAAESLEFADAVALVQKRGQFMQNAVPVGEGGMAAILGLDDVEVVEICQKCSDTDQVVQAANFNAPGQVVIAGHNKALNMAVEACKQAGAKRAMPLAVSAPFHSELMAPAAEKMAGVLADTSVSKPVIRVVQNVDAREHDDPVAIRGNLVKQMCSAVLWTDTIKLLAANDVHRIVECGPGRVLSGLNKRIDKSLESFSMNSVESIESSLQALAT